MDVVEEVSPEGSYKPGVGRLPKKVKSAWRISRVVESSAR